MSAFTRLDTYAMANARPKDTGLPMTVYINEKNARHGPRLKISQFYGEEVRPDALFSITISREPRIIGDRGDIRPRDIGLILEFIDLNMQLLMAYWEQDPAVATSDMLRSLRRIE